MGGNEINTFIMLGLVFVVTWIYLIRPKNKKEKELNKFREALAKGDHIVTIGGIHGKILEVTDSTVLVQSEGTKIRLDKSAISQSSEDQLMTK